MFLMTLRDLQFRARRVGVVTVLVALVLTLLYLMTGLVNQLQNEPGDTVARIGANEWIVAEGVSGPFTAVSVLPLALGESLGDVHPVVVSRGSLGFGDGETTEMVLKRSLGERVASVDEPSVEPLRALWLDEKDDLLAGQCPLQR